MSKDGLGTSFGCRVRRYREARGMTLVDLATRAGLTPNYIGGIETGSRAPSLTTLLAIAAGLGIQVGELVAMPGALTWAAGEMGRLFEAAPRRAQAVTLMAAGDDTRGAPLCTILPLALGLGVKASELPRPYDGFAPAEDDEGSAQNAATSKRPRI